MKPRVTAAPSLEQNALPRLPLELHHRAKQIAGGHHPNPRDKRVKDIEVRAIAERHQTRLMQDVPSPRPSAQLFSSDAIEQIVAAEHDEGHARNGPAGQPDQRREYHHRGSDHENDAGGQAVEIEVEPPAELDQREIDQDQPKAADEEEAA